MNPAAASIPERVAFLNALREIVGRRADIPKNKIGVPLVSDYDLVWSSESERDQAWVIARNKPQPQSRT